MWEERALLVIDGVGAKLPDFNSLFSPVASRAPGSGGVDRLMDLSGLSEELQLISGTSSLATDTSGEDLQKQPKHVKVKETSLIPCLHKKTLQRENINTAKLVC